MNKQLNKVVREPRWREEAKQAQPDKTQDYSHNGTTQQG
jgi:hypothetical protein